MDSFYFFMWLQITVLCPFNLKNSLVIVIGQNYYWQILVVFLFFNLEVPPSFFEE